MITLLTAIVLVLLSATQALATAQIPDVIVCDGNEYDLLVNPMESYFREHPEKKPKSNMGSTALWRGYVATFEVKNQRLLLKDIAVEAATKTADGEDSYAFKSVKADLLPDGQVMQIDWFSGILVIPTGKLVKYVHMGYASSYSSYILLEVKSGKITGERRFDMAQYEAFREKQFQAFKKTDAYKKQVAELQKKGNSVEFIDSFLRDFVSQYTSEFLDEESPATQPAKGK